MFDGDSSLHERQSELDSSGVLRFCGGIGPDGGDGLELRSVSVLDDGLHCKVQLKRNTVQ